MIQFLDEMRHATGEWNGGDQMEILGANGGYSLKLVVLVPVLIFNT